MQPRKLLAEGLIYLRILFLKAPKLFELQRGSKLFHSMIVEGKNNFLKKLCLILKKGMFFVAHVFSGTSLKRY